jgi:hypothetical protein
LKVVLILVAGLMLSACGERNESASAETPANEAEALARVDETGLSNLEDLPELRQWREAEEARSAASRDELQQSDPAPRIQQPAEPPLLPQWRDQVLEEVESSLLGDSNHAIKVATVLMRCRGNTLDEDRVVRQLQRLQQREVKPGTRWTFANGMTISYESYEQFESQLWRQHDQCQSVEGLFSNDLRGRIERLAEQGNPQARYLYAMWPPERSVFSTRSTLELLDYHNRALEFTWANLDQGEWLGLMAMGQSYSSSGRSLFTASDHALGRVFLMAAELCGLENDWLNEHNSEFRSRLRPGSADRMLSNFEQDAQGIAELFCG